MVKTKITRMDCDWTEIKNECRATIGKEATDKRPSKDFIMKLLIAEHSPIRLATIKWRWENLKSYVATHIVRHHEGIEKWVSTQRTDRTGIDRHKLPQDAPVTMDAIANAQALINIARFRLCFKADPDTRVQIENLKSMIREEGEHEIALCMQPNCVYRCGCPEFETCGYWQNLCKQFPNYTNLFNIKRRYELADEQFYERIKGRYEEE